MRGTIYASYLDASALVKIVADDGEEKAGRDAVRAHYFNYPLMYSSSFCITECFSSFKHKYVRKKIDRQT